MQESNRLLDNRIDTAIYWIIKYDIDELLQMVQVMRLQIDWVQFIDWCWDHEIRATDGMLDFHAALIIWCIHQSSLMQNDKAELIDAIRPWGIYTWIDLPPNRVQQLFNELSDSLSDQNLNRFFRKGESETR